MSENSNIEWTDHTFNPWIGCTKVSPGCDHCYAEQLMDARMHRVRWGAGQSRVRTSAENWLILSKRIGNARAMWSAEPLPNVWLGATVVNQVEADRDIPKLLSTPARLRFLSMEPLLEPVDLGQACGQLRWNRDGIEFRGMPGHLDWVIRRRGKRARRSAHAARLGAVTA
jgi:protein gp37